MLREASLTSWPAIRDANGAVHVRIVLMDWKMPGQNGIVVPLQSRGRGKSADRDHGSASRACFEAAKRAASRAFWLSRRADAGCSKPLQSLFALPAERAKSGCRRFRPSRLAGSHVLVAEDNPSISRSWSTALRRASRSSLRPTGEDRGRGRSRLHRFDAVIMDVQCRHGRSGSDASHSP